MARVLLPLLQLYIGRVEVLVETLVYIRARVGVLDGIPADAAVEVDIPVGTVDQYAHDDVLGAVPTNIPGAMVLTAVQKKPLIHNVAETESEEVRQQPRVREK